MIGIAISSPWFTWLAIIVSAILTYVWCRTFDKFYRMSKVDYDGARLVFLAFVFVVMTSFLIIIFDFFSLFGVALGVIIGLTRPPRPKPKGA